MAAGQTGMQQALAALDTAKQQLELEAGRGQRQHQPRLSIQAEIRTLEFWRAIIAECVATFFLVVLVCCSHQAINGKMDSLAAGQLYTATGTGLAVTALYHAFSPVSGGHFNPAVSLACMITKKISVLRAALYVCAQCGGAIAGAALVYGIYGAENQFVDVSVSKFGLEFIFTFIVVFIFFSANSPHGRARTADPALTIGLAYMAVLSCYKGALNPARALGPAFVSNEFELHWVFWIGPILGGICGAFCFQFIFNVHKTRPKKDVETCSVRSDDDMIDDLERVKQYRAGMMQTYTEGTAATASLYNTSVRPYKRPLEAESVYGGSKSLYNAPVGADNPGRRTPGLDCSKSVYAGEAERGGGFHKRGTVQRSHSVRSKAGPGRRNPYHDPLPPAQQDKASRGGGLARDPARDPHYADYVRRKNAAADQCSGSSSGYYSSSKEAGERAEYERQYEERCVRDYSGGGTLPRRDRVPPRNADYTGTTAPRREEERYGVAGSRGPPNISQTSDPY